jgi:hypothetical protein
LLDIVQTTSNSIGHKCDLRVSLIVDGTARAEIKQVLGTINRLVEQLVGKEFTRETEVL